MADLREDAPLLWADRVQRAYDAYYRWRGVPGRFRMDRVLKAAGLRTVIVERERYRQALHEIACRPVLERNPDGDDQAAAVMQLIAREALDC